MAMDRPRIAVVGKSRSILSWFDDVVAGFREAGAEVAFISLQAEGPGERLSSRSGGAKELENAKVVERTAGELARFGPDLVLVLNKFGLTGAVAESWRRAVGDRVPMVGWICDCVHGAGPELLPVFDGIYYFDSHSVPVLEEFQSRGGVRWLDYLPLAVAPARYRYRVGGKRKPWLVFAGKCSGHRKEVFEEIRRAGLRIDLYGPGAGDWRRFWRMRRIPPAALGAIYRGHLGVINVPQPGNTEFGLNLRAFEIPCSGGLGIYPDLPDVERCFKPDEEILVYRDHRELVEKVDQLKRDPERVEAMVEAGRRRVLNDHTFECRARKVMGDWRLLP